MEKDKAVDDALAASRRAAKYLAGKGRPPEEVRNRRRSVFLAKLRSHGYRVKSTGPNAGIDDDMTDQEAGTGSVRELRGRIAALETELAAARQKVEVEHDKYLRAWHHRCKAMSERDEARADLAAARELLKAIRAEVSDVWLGNIADRIDAALTKGDGDE